MLTAYAQKFEVTGKVINAEDGLPVIGATVVVKGTTIGTITDINGEFTLKAPSQDTVLRISFVGLETQTIPINGREVINVTLSPETVSLEEVVVTAMGIKKEKRALGYATQDVSGDEVASSGEEDVSKALQGKVAGVTVRQSSGMPGASSSIQIRGASSLILNNQPLYVVDGMPIESGQVFSTGTGGADASNRSLDLNPDDIESINVLKGPTAAALYGMRASNGVVVITTKSGKAAEDGKAKTVVTINSGISFQQVSRLPDVQTTYAQGTNGQLGLYSPYSWGPQIDTLKPYYSQEESVTASSIHDYPIEGEPTNEPKTYNSMEDFFQTGYNLNNSIDISSSSELGNYSLGFGNTTQEGIIPTTGMDKYNFKFNGTFNMNEKFKVGASVNYATNHVDKVPSGNTQSNPLFTVYPCPVSYDLTGKQYEDEDNEYIQKHYRKLMDNPYWALEHNKFYEETERVFGNVSFVYDPFEWLNVTYRVGVDHFVTNDKAIYSLGSGSGRAYPELGVDEPSGGEIYNNNIQFKGFNSTLLLNANKRFTDDLNLDVTVGNEIVDDYSVLTGSYGTGILTGGSESIISTSSRQPVIPFPVHTRNYGYFTTFTLDYKGMLFFNPTARADYVSNMPSGSRTFFYPSASSSFIFTRLSPLSGNDFLPYGKLRIAFSQVGQAGNPYSTKNKFTQTNLSGSGVSYSMNNGYTNYPTLFTQGLMPQNTRTYEAGLDLRLLKNKISINYTYYITSATNQIFEVPIAYSTGYYNEYRNAGELLNNGHEAILTIKAVETDNFNWEVVTNFTAYKNKVKSLAEGVEMIPVGSNFESFGTFAVAGEYYPMIFGASYMRDDNDNIVVDSRDSIGGVANPSYGMPIEDDPKVLGKVDPDFEVSLINKFNYKSFSFSFQVDWREGSQMFSGTNALLYAYGMAGETENREEMVVFGDGDAVMGYLDDDGELVVEGKNDIEIQKGRIYWDEVMWNITEAHIYETSFIRLREVSFGYRLPEQWFSDMFVSGASVYLTGRNLLLLYTPYPNFDPESSTAGGNGTGGFEYVSLPNTRSFGGGFKLIF